MNRSSAIAIVGVLLIIVGAFISSDSLIDLIRGPALALQQKLLLGALLFRAGLVVLGVYLISLAWLFTYKLEGWNSLPVEASSRHALLLLLCLTVIAFGIRSYRLDLGIWLDEIMTFVNYMPLPLGDILTTYDDANNHLLFTLLARFSFSVFGESVWSLRLPAVIFGVASIPALYFFARQVASGREALFSAALFAFSYHHVWFSQNARGYTALLFWTLVSSTFLLIALRSNRIPHWLLYAICAAMGAFTHLTMGFVIVAHFCIYVVVAYKQKSDKIAEKWIGCFVGFVFTGLLCYQLYALVLPQMAGGGLASGAQGTVSEWTNPLWTVLEIVKGMQIGFSTGFVALAAFAVFGIGLFDFLRKRPVVVGLFLIPTLLGFLVMVGIGYTLFPRFFFFAMGFAVVVVIRGATVSGNIASKILRIPADKFEWLGISACAGMLLISALSLPFAFGPKQDYTGALDLIEQKRETGDAVVTLGIAGFPFKQYYKVDWGQVDTLAELEATRAQAKRTWLVYMMPVHAKSAYPKVFASLQKDFVLVQQFYGTLNGGTVVVYLADS